MEYDIELNRIFTKKIKLKNTLLRYLKRLLSVVFVLFLLYGITLVFFYFKQEKFFFNGKKLDSDYVFKFQETFDELKINVTEGVDLSGLLFYADKPKGVVLYLHGNAGAISDWGKRAHLFLDNNYDVLFVDYRGYGKSQGVYSKNNQLYNDVQKVYDFVKSRYKEEDIVVLGFSLGSGLAAYLASENKPKKLILNAPYYSWKTLVAEEIAPPIPKYLIKYDIATYQFMDNVECPVQIFHGSRDYLIEPETNSVKLRDLYPNKIKLTFIEDASHNNIHITKEYYELLKMTL